MSETYILKENSSSPVRDYDFFQSWTLSWMDSLFKVGSKRPLEMRDIPDLPDSCSVALFESEIRRAWDQEMERAIQQKRPPSLQRALWNAFGLKMLFAGSFRIVSDFGSIFAPFLLRLLVTFVSDTQVATKQGQAPPPIHHGYLKVT
jgi:hypothetical protein